MAMTPMQLACRDALDARYTELYYALHRSAPPTRARLLAVHALAQELGRAARASAEPELVRVKLQWWHEQLQRAADGRAQHPLLLACAGTGLDWASLAPLVDAAGEELNTGPFDDPAGLHTHLARRHGPLGRIAATLTGCIDSATPDAMAQVATAAAHARALVQLGADARAGRALIAQQDLRRFGLDRGDLRADAGPGRIGELAALLHERAVGYHRQALAEIPRIDLAVQLPGRVLAEYEFARLAETGRTGYRVLDRRIELTPLRLLWIAWRSR